MKTQFLKSRRFWAGVVALVAVYLEKRMWLPPLETSLVVGILTLFVTLETVNKFRKPVEKKK